MRAVTTNKLLAQNIKQRFFNECDCLMSEYKDATTFDFDREGLTELEIADEKIDAMRDESDTSDMDKSIGFITGTLCCFGMSYSEAMSYIKAIKKSVFKIEADKDDRKVVDWVAKNIGTRVKLQ